MKINTATNKLSEEFLDFYLPLHKEYYNSQNNLLMTRREKLRAAHGSEPYASGFRNYSLPYWKGEKGRSYDELAYKEWHIELPAWCQDQRNQMTGPADNGALVVKMINSGAPGVMLDLEDSMANTWSCLNKGYVNIRKALSGTLTYEKHGETIGITGNPVIWNRIRGMHLTQVVGDLVTSASLFDMAMITFKLDRRKLKHPLCFYLPKSESSDDGRKWAQMLKAIARAREWPANYIKCMALVEAHPLAYELEHFIINMRDHLLGLNLGRYDYMASWIDWNMVGRDFLLPDRNTIPHDVAFFQNLRHHMVDICHKYGILAIGGMTALFPSRTDSELNDKALAVLEEDKANEACCGMDGAWTGHPDQNKISIDQFPEPNQLDFVQGFEPKTMFRSVDDLVGGEFTVEGTRQCVRVAIRYRNGVINGKGAVLLDGYMEDLATDRICRLMIAQRMKHMSGKLWGDKEHTIELVDRLFDEELNRLLEEKTEIGNEDTLQEAAVETKALIYSGQHNPV